MILQVGWKDHVRGIRPAEGIQLISSGTKNRYVILADILAIAHVQRLTVTHRRPGLMDLSSR